MKIDTLFGLATIRLPQGGDSGTQETATAEN
jgi:hypothetical protein